MTREEVSIEEIKQALEFARLTKLMGGTVMIEEKLIDGVLQIIGEVERLREREYNHYPITILELESRIFKLQEAFEKITDCGVTGEDARDMHQIARKALERTNPHE